MVSKHSAGAAAPGALLVQCRAGFTLIELLAVMTIILILAGLILSIAGNANYKAGTSRAQGEIQKMSTALQSYYTDNAAFPSSPGATGTNALDPTATPPVDPAASGSPNAYQSAGEILFEALAGYNSSGGTTGTNGNTLTIYDTTYGSGQIASGGSPMPSPPYSTTALAATYFVDPFGFPYGYSTEYATLSQTASASGSPAPSPAHGYNPTYDLWSTAGYSSTVGKSYPTNVSVPNSLWVKNW